jgi:arylsulfatase A-like enzyme
VISNEIMHATDWFTTLLAMTGLDAPDDRVIDGKNQTALLSGQDEGSNRDGFIYWNGEQMYGVKWHNFKFVMVQPKYFTDAYSPSSNTASRRNPSCPPAHPSILCPSQVTYTRPGRADLAFEWDKG